MVGSLFFRNDKLGCGLICKISNVASVHKYPRDHIEISEPIFIQYLYFFRFPDLLVISGLCRFVETFSNSLQPDMKSETLLQETLKSCLRFSHDLSYLHQISGTAFHSILYL